MTETYAAEVLADSVSPDGVRLTTLWVTFPRFILAEVNTHRMFSRNSNSSRAIPPERQIEKVKTNPFVPETFNKRVKGMGVGEALPTEDQEKARSAWIRSSQRATEVAETLLSLDCDKSRINRLLEPFLWHSAVITATEWDNFFALRDHPAAQPEFQIVAGLMRNRMDESEPDELSYGEWHLPGLVPGDKSVLGTTALKMRSAGRLARWTSYDRADDEPVAASLERAEKMISGFHLSPTEHQARPFSQAEMKRGDEMRKLLFEWKKNGAKVPRWMFDQTYFCGNLKGWVQFRKEIDNESNAALAANLA